jgi:hypothetical protein
MIYVFTMNEAGHSTTLWRGEAISARLAIQAAINSDDITEAGSYYTAEPGPRSINIQRFEVKPRGLEVV